MFIDKKHQNPENPEKRPENPGKTRFLHDFEGGFSNPQNKIFKTFFIYYKSPCNKLLENEFFEKIGSQTVTLSSNVLSVVFFTSCVRKFWIFSH